MPDMAAHNHRAVTQGQPAPSQPAAPAQPPADALSGMPMGEQMPDMDHEGSAGADPHAMAGMAASAMMTGALGPYPMTREASGTSWQPDASEHAGVYVMRGDWMLMGHALLNGVYDWQKGPRGTTKTFASGMIMGMAERRYASGDVLQFRMMLSPDPFMGKRGYPLLLASGETADGVTPLVDRQHPHDLFMELSASYSRRLTDRDSVFLYAGLPGEPAFGPPAYMHRQSIMDSPEAPISHHWLDSTHITMGVVTAGYVHGDWKAEVSRYRGREPDQHRFDIESPKLDSTAVRLSWNPTRTLSLQTSWAQAKDVEQLDPGEGQTKWSASAIYTVPFGRAGWWSTTAAWGRRRTSGRDGLNAWVLESAAKPDDVWTVFGRAEWTANDELTTVGGGHGPAYDVGKVSIGAIHDWRVAEKVKVGLGGLYAWDFVPGALDQAYGDDPKGAMAFVRLKIG
jgi:hypothetical protein